QGLACRPDRVQGIALGTGPAGWSLGPADLHHLLAPGLQENPVSPAPSLPAPSTAQQRRPGTCALAKASSCW
ncbi:MAG TPA: hypothetical protein VF468_08115, partial [Actinomycetota bacterium]|nr:hypothetical protein [Actinomycetota bacterium]